MSMQDTEQRQPSRPENGAIRQQRLPATELDTAAVEIEKAWRRYTLRFLRSSWNAPPVVLGVTSAIRGEGRTTSSVMLAVGLASETSAPVALLGLDFQGYGLAEAFGMRDTPDLEGVLRGTWTLEAALTATGLPGLTVLPAYAGPREHLPPRVFWPALRRRLPRLMDELRKDFAYLVCDMPPLLDAEAAELLHEMSALVLLTRSGITPMPKLEEALGLLQPETIAGVVHIGPQDSLPKWVSSLLLE